MDFASCNPCQVQTANLGLVETILADLKFVSRSKTQQQRLPPGKALLTAKHYFSPSSPPSNTRLPTHLYHADSQGEKYATSLLRHLHFPSSSQGSILLAGAAHPSKVHAGARIPSELFSARIRNMDPRYFWRGEAAPKQGIISYESLFLKLSRHKALIDYECFYTALTEGGKHTYPATRYI